MEKTAKKTPQVSIGMPVYNGEQFIRKALDSLLEQTFADFELIISDNASTDETEAICREYETRDSRIRYVRWPENRGAQENFVFVLIEAVGKYFMWAACDDIRSPDYLALNVEFLNNHQDYVASTCPVCFQGEQFDDKRMGDATLAGDIADRVSNFFGVWHANGRFYSLFRTSSVRNNPHLKKDYFGSDWVFMLYEIMRGKTNRVQDGWIKLGKSGFSNSGKIISHYRKSFIHWPFPFYDLIYEVNKLIKILPYGARLWVNYNLLTLNLQAIRISLASFIKSKLK